MAAISEGRSLLGCDAAALRMFGQRATPSRMVFESNEIHVASGKGPTFEATFVGARSLLLGVSGCRSAELFRRIGEPDRYQVRIGWERLEDHVEIYPGTAQAAEIRALLAPLITGIDRGHYEAVIL